MNSLKGIGQQKGVSFEGFSKHYSTISQMYEVGNCTTCGDAINDSCEDKIEATLTAAQKLLNVVSITVNGITVPLATPKNITKLTFRDFMYLMDTGGGVTNGEKMVKNDVAYNATTGDFMYRHIGQNIVSAITLSDSSVLTMSRKCTEKTFCMYAIALPSVMTNSFLMNGVNSGTVTAITAPSAANATTLEGEILAILPANSVVKCEFDAIANQIIVRLMIEGNKNLSLSGEVFSNFGCEPRFV